MRVWGTVTAESRLPDAEVVVVVMVGAVSEQAGIFTKNEALAARLF